MEKTKPSIRALFITDAPENVNRLQKPLSKAGIALLSAPLSPSSIDPDKLNDTVDVLLFNFDNDRSEYQSVIKYLRPRVPNIPFFVITDQLPEENMVELIRIGFVGVFTSIQTERLYEVILRSVNWQRVTDRELNFATTDYENLFIQVPDPIFLEDMSVVKRQLDNLREQGITDFYNYFHSNLEEAARLARSILIVDANQAALNYYGISSIHDVFQMDQLDWSDERVKDFISEFVFLAEGNTEFSIQGVTATKNTYIMEFRVVKGNEHDLRRVMVAFKDVTNIVKSQQEIKAKEDQLRSLVEQTPSIFYTETADPAARLLYMSPQIEEISGYTSSEWLEDQEMWKKVVHPEDWGFVSRINDFASSLAPTRIDYRMISKSGKITWVRDNFILVRDDAGNPAYWQGAMYDVSDEKDAELRLRESQKLLQHLMNSIPGMVYRTRAKEPAAIEFLSEGCLSLTGYEPAELLALNRRQVRELLKTTDSFYENPEPFKALPEHGYFEQLYTLCTRSGEIRWVMDRGYSFLDENGEIEMMEGVMLDITERKRAEEQVKKFSDELEQLYQNSVFMSALIDPERLGKNVVDAISGHPNWDLVGIALISEPGSKIQVLAAQSSSQLKSPLPAHQIINQIAASEAAMGSFKARKAVRGGIAMQASQGVDAGFGLKSSLCVPLVSGDHALGVIVVKSCIPNAFTEDDEKLLSILAAQVATTLINIQSMQIATNEIQARKLAQEELLAQQQKLEQRVAERTLELQQANRELEKSSQLKSEFLAAVSHELRTPLTGILGLSEVLTIESLGPLNDKQSRSIRLIAENGHRLLNMINDILDYTRLEAGQLQLTVGKVNLNALLKNLSVMYQLEAESREIPLLLSLPEEEIAIDCDSKRMKQLLGNLLSNAIKFTPVKGKVQLSLQAHPQKGSVSISVSDSGIGINEKDRVNLFKPFIQLDGRLERSYNGAGLGLVLVSKLVELHKGQIEVQSEVGKGSTFTVWLPMHQ